MVAVSEKLPYVGEFLRSSHHRIPPYVRLTEDGKSLLGALPKKGLCTKTLVVGGVSDADFAQLHTLVTSASLYRGQRPLLQTFCAKPAKLFAG